MTCTDFLYQVCSVIQNTLSGISIVRHLSNGLTNMLLSPQRIHQQLVRLTSTDDTLGPHTALLILPQGQLISSAMAVLSDQGQVEQHALGETANEPWLEGPERIRILLGLASQWGEEDSPRIECEVRTATLGPSIADCFFQLGRLYLCSVSLPPLEMPTASAVIPSLREPSILNFNLVLNGTLKTPWSQLSAKVRMSDGLA